MPSAAEEIEALRAALAAAEARVVAAEAQALDAARDRAVLSGAEALIAALRLEIEKLRRALYGARSERKARLLDQLELQLEELEAAATEDELAAEAAVRPNAPAPLVRARRRTGRKPFPAHLPRERVVSRSASCCRSPRPPIMSMWSGVPIRRVCRIAPSATRRFGLRSSVFSTPTGRSTAHARSGGNCAGRGSMSPDARWRG